MYLNKKQLSQCSGALRGLMAGLGFLFLASCSALVGDDPEVKHNVPIRSLTMAKMEEKGLFPGDPILIRIFKQDSVLEIWKRNRVSGKYQFLKDYSICAWSGEFGPKKREGDRQAPEGFYFINKGLLNPYSSYHLAFNLGYPNSFDRALGRTGMHLMVHGACSSRGCYSMEDEQIEDIYALMREAFEGGQKNIQVQAFPFRMTKENMLEHVDSEHFGFWLMLKEGSDHFETTKNEPVVRVCDKRYVFDPNDPGRKLKFSPKGSCPSFSVDPKVIAAMGDRQAELVELSQLAPKSQQLIAMASYKTKKPEASSSQSILSRYFGPGNLPQETEGEAKQPAFEIGDAQVSEGEKTLLELMSGEGGDIGAVLGTDEAGQDAGGIPTLIEAPQERPSEEGGAEDSGTAESN